MKVVLDTNVLVSGIFFGKGPGKIIELWLAGKFSVYATPAILEEYLRIIEILTKGNKELFQHWSALLPGVCHLVDDAKDIFEIPFSRDPHDDKFLWCGLRVKADYLISGDKDLRVLGHVFPFQIFSPNEFLSALAK